MDQTPPAQTIEAERFVLKDHQGRPRAVLETRADDSPRLALRDKDGKDRLELHIAPDGAPVLNFLDQSGAIRLGLMVTHNGDPDVNFMDKAGEIRLNLGVAGNGAPEVGLLGKNQRSGLMQTLTPNESFLLSVDEAGKSRLAVAVTPDGSSALQFFDKAETPRLVIGLSQGQAPMWAALDEAGKTRVGMVTEPNGQVTLECCDAAERLRVKLTVASDGHPSLLVFDEHGHALGQAGSGAAALLKAGVTQVPKVVGAVQDALKLWELVAPLL